MKYLEREIERRIEAALKVHPVIVLTGPRQVGKSTLLENAACLRRWRYLTLDDPDILEQAREDPKGLLEDDRPTIIDEVQRNPELLLTVKYFVDRSARNRKFILSGSGNVSLRGSPRETLAGRTVYLPMSGFSQMEIRKSPHGGMLKALIKGEQVRPLTDPAGEDLAGAVWKGGLPAIVLASHVGVACELMAGYVDTYLERDIQDLVRIRQPDHFRKLMKAMAQATGWESKQEELSRLCGEERSNVSRYLSLLKDTQLLYELRGYAVKGERVYRQAKYYWFDSGMACFLAGVRKPADLKRPELRGKFFENFVFQQVLAWASLQVTRPEIYYWKSKAEDKVEVDFVIQQDGIVLPMEVKSAKSLDFRDARSVREFLKRHPEASRGVMVYGGTEVKYLASNVVAVPWYLL